jgi:hypothetical protein
MVDILASASNDSHAVVFVVAGDEGRGVVCKDDQDGCRRDDTAANPRSLRTLEHKKAATMRVQIARATGCKSSDKFEADEWK